MELLEFRVTGEGYAEYVLLKVRDEKHGKYWKVLRLVRLLRNPREYS